MHASLNYLLRNLRRRRTRTIIGASGIFLTLALLTAIQIGMDSISTSYVDLAALQAGKADVVITLPGGSPFQPLAFDPSEVSQRIAGSPCLRGLAPRLSGIVQVGPGGTGPFAILLGLDPQRERELDLSGLVPEPALEDGTCAISPSLAERLQAGRGSLIPIRSPAQSSPHSLRLETIIKRQLLLPQEARDYLVVNHATARTLLGEPTRVHSLAGSFRAPSGYYDARDLQESVRRIKDAGESLAAAAGEHYAVRLPKAAAIAAFQHFASPVRAVFGVFALLALFIAGLLIHSLISVSVEERIREFGVLRTLGAKSRHIFRLVLGESVLLCLLGVVPGVLAGRLIAELVVKLVALATKAGQNTIGIEMSPNTLWLTLSAGAILSIGSALVPAVRATRWRIVDALDPLRRGQLPLSPPREGQANRPLLLGGLGLSAISVVVFFVLPSAFLSGDPSLIGAVLLCLLLTILLGFTLLAMGLLPLFERLVLGLAGWAFGPVAELAGRNLERHRRRHTTTALLFTLSVALVIFLASLAALFSRTALALVENAHGADLRLQTSPGTGEALPLRTELERTSGVAGVSEAQFLRSRSEAGVAYDVVVSDLVGLRHLWIFPFGVDAELSRVLYTHRIAGSSGSGTALAELHSHAVQPGEATAPGSPLPAVILSQAAATYLGVTPGDPVQLSFRLGAQRTEARFRVAATFRSLPGFENFRSRVASATGSGALLSLDNLRTMARGAPPETFQNLLFVKAASADITAQKALAREMRERLDARHRFRLKCTAEQKEQTRALYWVTQVFFGLMLGGAVVIAVFALIASMATTVLERRWEIGVLKALGLRRKQLFRLFLAESVVLTLSAGIAGGAIGFSLAWLFMVQAAALMEVATVFTLPYLTFLSVFAVSLAAGSLAAHVPTRTLLKKPAAEILRW